MFSESEQPITVLMRVQTIENIVDPFTASFP